MGLTADHLVGDPDHEKDHNLIDAALSTSRLRVSDLGLNVKSAAFGARGDGVTDDTAAINAAYAACGGASGGVVLYPPGEYLVRPDAVTRVALSVPGPKVESRGAGRGRSAIKLAGGVGDYLAVLMAANAVNASGFTVADLTVDQNSANNVITNGASSGPLFNGFPRYAVYTGQGAGQSVERCDFVNGDTVNHVVLNGSDLAVRSCRFLNVGANSPRHDHSSIYLAGQGIEVSGCTFRGSGVSATTAIETHGGSQNVHDNHVYSFFCLTNITGVASSSKSVAVHHNHGHRVGFGIDLWAYIAAGNATGWGMEGVTVDHNIIEIDYDLWTAVVGYKNGIGFDPLNSLGIRNLKILDNAITYLPFASVPTAVDALSAGIRLSRSSPYSGVDSNIVVAGNTVSGPPAAGMYLNLQGSTTQRLRVDDNLFVNPGMGGSAFSSSYKAGLLVAGSLTDARINRNTAIDDQAAHTMNTGINLSLVSAAVNVEAIGSNSRAADGGAVPTLVLPSGVGGIRTS